MSTSKGQRYGRVMQHLAATDHEAFRTILSRVESYKSINATLRAKQKTHDYIVHVLEQKLQAAEDQLVIAQSELTRVTRGDTTCR